MSRVEENRKYIKYLDSETEKLGDMPFQSATAWTLCEMRGLLADISKSLAVIADAKEATTEVLDKIRTEIDQKQYDFMADKDYDEGIRFGLMLAYQIINKYKAESEVQK